MSEIIRLSLQILLLLWTVTSSLGDPIISHPVCDVSVQSVICLHNEEQVILPSARPYGLALHLSFDEVRPLDSSGARNHAAGEPMAAAGFSGIGSSALFRRNFILVPHSDSFSTADFSYTLFVYLLEDAASVESKLLHDEFCPIVHKGIMSDKVEEAAPAILINPKDGKVKVVVATTATVSSAGEEMQSNSRLKPHQWYHLAVVRHLNRVRLYINGILDSTFVTEGSTRTNDLPLYIGSAPYAENACDVPLLIDELRYYSMALGKDHIQAEASATLGGVEPSFIHISCIGCGKIEAAEGCPTGHHLCNKLELYTGAYQVARTLSLVRTIDEVLHADDEVSRKGVGICCADAS